jgi:hypothetical protein
MYEAHAAQNTHLDRQQLSYCVSLIENGANPEALAVRPPSTFSLRALALTLAVVEHC